MMDDQFDHLCMQLSERSASWVRTKYCSLPKGHDPAIDPHRAWVGHVITGQGKDVMWLGPWADGTAFRDAEADRLQDEWEESR